MRAGPSAKQQAAAADSRQQQAGSRHQTAARWQQAASRQQAAARREQVCRQAGRQQAASWSVARSVYSFLHLLSFQSICFSVLRSAVMFRVLAQLFKLIKVLPVSPVAQVYLRLVPDQV